MCNLSSTLRQRPNWWVTYPNQTVEDLCSGQEGTTVKVKAPVGEVEVSLTAKQVCRIMPYKIHHTHLFLRFSMF